MIKSHPPCLEWREKLALRRDDLSLTDQQALDAHVQKCPACAATLADYHFFEARLDALPPPAIKPLPRLSPQFFEQSEQAQKHRHTKSERATSAPDWLARPAHRGARAIGRTFAVAAVIGLLLAASLLFRVIYQARLASHPNTGNTLLNLNQDTNLVSGVAWSPDGKKLATASWDDIVTVWNAQNGTVECAYSGHTGDVFALAWSPNGAFIASAGADNTVQIWYASNCQHSRTYSEHTHVVVSVAWAPDGSKIISGDSGGVTNIWSVNTLSTVRTLPPTLNNEYVSSVAWSPNGAYLAVGSWDEFVRIWDARTGALLHSYRYNDTVNALAWSPASRGNDLAVGVGEADSVVDVWNVDSWHITQTYTGHTHAVNAVAWSPDGVYLASASNDKTVRVWNSFTGKTLMVYTGHTDDVSSVAWSPNGQKIASGSWDFTTKVWKVTGLSAPLMN